MSNTTQTTTVLPDRQGGSYYRTPISLAPRASGTPSCHACGARKHREAQVESGFERRKRPAVLLPEARNVEFVEIGLKVAPLDVQFGAKLFGLLVAIFGQQSPVPNEIVPKRHDLRQQDGRAAHIGAFVRRDR